VPAEMIVAIIGVESKYGLYKGKYRVLDSLATLVVGYPRRSEFFAQELEAFLILCKTNQFTPRDIFGSYAGAVGYPQFISSSYQNYAVDFSGDGRIDLIDQPIDAIGSVANYFVKNGWRRGEPVSSNAFNSVAKPVADKANRKRSTRYRAGELRTLGAKLDDTIKGEEKLNVLSLNPSDVVRDTMRDGEYIVRAGDTACKIAETLGVSCKTIFNLNRLDSKGTIYRGQTLKVPSVSEESRKKLSSKWVVSNPEAEIFFYTHENFYVITRYNHSVLYAMAVNELSKAIKAYRSGEQYQWN